MELEDIRTFVALAATRSFSGAAKELFLTQSAVTRRLQRLEQALGGSLVDRRRRPLVLTAAGQAALERSQQLLDSLQALRTVIRNDPQSQREFRIGVAHALTEFALTTPVERARREFPRVAVLLTTGWSRELVTMVRAGHLDAAFVLLAADESLAHDVEGQEVATERLVAIGARRVTGRRSARPSPSTLPDLDGAEWILNPQGCAARASLLQVLTREHVRCRVAVETYTYEMQVALVARGRGFGLIPERLLDRSAYRSQVRPLAIEALRFRFRIWSIHRQLPPELSAALEAMVDEIKRELDLGASAGPISRRPSARP